LSKETKKAVKTKPAKEDKKIAKEKPKAGQADKKVDEKPVYIICPRCELNYITKKDGHCKVCKAEMGLIDAATLVVDVADDEERLCPSCNLNYIAEDENICFLCLKSSAAEEESEDDKDGFSVFDPEEGEHSLDEKGEDLEPVVITADLEDDEDDEESADGEDYSELYKEPDDFVYEIDESDFEDRDIDDDEEDEEDEDF